MQSCRSTLFFLALLLLVTLMSQHAEGYATSARDIDETAFSVAEDALLSLSCWDQDQQRFIDQQREEAAYHRCLRRELLRALTAETLPNTGRTAATPEVLAAD